MFKSVFDNQAFKIRRYFTGIHVYGLWWSYTTKTWGYLDDPLFDKRKGYSNQASCRTYKAFLRHLRKHPELKGFRVELINRYKGFNVTAEPVKPEKVKS